MKKTPSLLSKIKAKEKLSAPSNCKFCSKEFASMYASNAHQAYCKENPSRRTGNPHKGIIHTQESKDKISLARKNYIKLNLDKVPYKLNHTSKGSSYAENYFREILTDNNLKFEEQFRIGLYKLDFAFLDKMIDLEIDGNQHFVRGVRVESDYRRDKNLNDVGWTTIRIVWSEYQKMSLEEKTKFISDLIGKLS